MNRRVRRPGTATLAGWLFADLMLVLFLIAMAVQPHEKAKDRPTAERTEPARTARVLSRDFCEFLIPVRADGLLAGRSARADLLRKLDETLRGEHPSWFHGPEMGRRTGRDECQRHLTARRTVGFFLAYGAMSDTNSGVVLGRNAAKAITAGNRLFREAIHRAAWTGGQGDGAVQLIVFFYRN
ncbi:hypothetical protein [Actinomadura flavalba]|uniref:hypothetical protein n=1 Tax=Actinomadura flavalba TaxID=1120938 RepID=UPI00037F7393|nr:hypothetical protein [Actinomadura flavalba]